MSTQPPIELAGALLNLVASADASGFHKAAAALLQPYGCDGIQWAMRMGDDWSTVFQQGSAALDGETVECRQAGIAHRIQWGSGMTPDLCRPMTKLLVAADAAVHQARLAMDFASSSDFGDQNVGTAVVTRAGQIEYADPVFSSLFAEQIGRAKAGQLPFSITWSEQVAYSGLVWRKFFVRVRRFGARYHLQARPDRRAPELTQREYDVASRVARGMTFKEIGRDLGMAPSTASTHVYKIYDKLGLSKRSELVNWMQAYEAADTGRRSASPRRSATPQRAE